MIAALVYLRLTSLVNAYRAKFKRLKQPRYLAGAVVGAGYFYFFFLRHLVSAHSPFAQLSPFQITSAATFEPIAAGALFAYLIGLWIFPSGRAALAFTEAEIAFLFPAPISRRNLIHFKIASGQIKIITSAAFFSLISHRWGAVGSGFLIQFLSWWIVLSFINLHRIGAAFTRDRLLEVGVNPLRRRLFASVIFLAVVGLSYAWLQRFSPSLLDAEGNFNPLAFFTTLLASPPLRWIIWPLRWVVRPAFATSALALLRAVGPALALLALEYLWVLKSEVSFEEASIATARQRTEKIEAMRSGKARSSAPKQARLEPFKLRPTGFRAIAFLWRNLISAGSFAYPRVWLIAAVILIGVTRWLAQRPEYESVVKMIAVFASILVGYGLLFSPVIARRGSQRLIEQIDIIKAYPLRGWEVILGELLCPVILLSFFEWILLGMLATAVQHGNSSSDPLIFSAAIAAGQIIPFLAAMLFALNFAGVLIFPAWSYNAAQTAGGGGGAGGLDRIGQRLIFFAGYMFVALVALLPASLGGAFVFLVMKFLFEYATLGTILAGTTTALILGGELSVILWWLGERYENFDLSAELPR